MRKISNLFFSSLLFLVSISELRAADQFEDAERSVLELMSMLSSQDAESQIGVDPTRTPINQFKDSSYEEELKNELATLASLSNSWRIIRVSMTVKKNGEATKVIRKYRKRKDKFSKASRLVPHDVEISLRVRESGEIGAVIAPGTSLKGYSFRTKMDHKVWDLLLVGEPLH